MTEPDPGAAQQPGPRWVPPPPTQPRTSGFAIASLVLGLLGGIVLSVIFGIVALRRIKRRGLRGRGLAIGGLVASGLWIVLIAVVVTFAVLTGAQRSAAGEITKGGSVSVEDLRVGDCLKDVEETDFALSADAVPCRQLHDAEVVDFTELGGDDFPGDEDVLTEADDRCGSAVSSAAVSGAEAFYFVPSEGSWDEGDRRVTCVLLLGTSQRGKQSG